MAARGILDDITAGQDYVSGLFDTQAKLRAGRAYAGGDYAGASGILASRGDLESAERISQRGARTDVLSAVDNKDFGAARTAAASAGNTGLYDAASGAEDDETAQKTQWLTQATDALKQLPAESRQKAFTDYIAPTIKMMGADDAMLSAVTATELTDEALDAFKASLGGKSGKRIEKIGDSLVEIGSDGTAREIYKAPAGSKVVGNSLVTDDGQVLYTAPEYRSVAADTSLVEIGGGGGGAPVSGGSQLPRGLRNNNPGNIEDGAFAKSQPGYKGSDGRFAIFETADAGQAAQAALLQSYGSRGINTISAAVNRWAPKSDGNDSTAYANYVASRLGVSADTPIDLTNPKNARALATVMAEFENGPQSKSSGVAPAGGGARVIAQGPAKQKSGPEWVSETINGTSVLVNKTTGDRKADPTIPIEKPSKLGADAIARFSLMVPSAVTAVRTMKRLEDGGYSLNKDAVAARVAQTMGPGGIIGGAARTMAGQDYQNYNQAAKAFESSILPILSGAAVSESEAERLVTAALPQIGDTKETAKTKAQSRQNMVKAAEMLLRGASTRDIAALLIPADLAPAPSGSPKPAPRAPPRVGEVKNGYRYTGGNPSQPSSWAKL